MAYVSPDHAAWNAAIVDSQGRVFTLVRNQALGYQVAINNVVDTSTKNVIRLEAYKGYAFYHTNVAAEWYYYNPPNGINGWVKSVNPALNPPMPTPPPTPTPTPPPPPTPTPTPPPPTPPAPPPPPPPAPPPPTPGPSKDGTKATAPGTTLRDASGNAWALVPAAASSGRGNYQITRNGTLDGSTGEVNLIEIYGGGVFWQRNSAGNWYEWVNNGWTLNNSGAPPTPAPTPAPTPTPTPTGGTGPSASGSLATVDFTAPTGHTVYPQAFGVASSGITNGSFSNCTNGQFQSLVRALNLPLIRINGITFGGTNNNFNQGDVVNFAQNVDKLLPSNCTLIMGILTNWNGPTDPGSYQNYCQAFAQYWKNTTSFPIAYWECWNEPGFDVGTYNGLYNAMMNGVKQVFPNAKGTGPTTAWYNAQGLCTGLYGQQNLGIINFHAYDYCMNGDGSNIPPDQHVANGSTNIVGQVTSAGNDARGNSSAANLPIGLFEWSIECGANNETRTQTNLGACFMTSVTLDCVIGAGSNPFYGGVWDLCDDAGANYNLIYPDYTLGAQYYMLQKLVASMPGTMVNASGQGGLKVYGTVNGGHYGVAIVNTNNNNVSGSIGLSHWPVNSNGNGNANVWMLTGSNQQGGSTTATVGGGVLNNVTIPGYSVCIVTPA